MSARVASTARLALALASCLAGLASHARAQAPAAQQRVQIGTDVAPDTVVVGQPFRVTVRVRAPRGATIRFPAPPDTTGAVQGRGASVVRAAADPAAVEQTATYLVAAWDVDSQVVTLGEVVVTAAGVERRVAVGSMQVFVRRILPEDTSLHVPKPARALVVTPLPYPWWWWLVAAAAAAALVGAWLWWRRRRRRGAIPEDPYERAEREFARVEQLALVDAGERGRHVALMVDVLRDYLAARIPVAMRSHTSGELLRATYGIAAMPADRLSRVLRETDLVKFARFPVTGDRALALGAEARGIAAAVEQARKAEEAAARAAEEAARNAQGKAA